MNVPSGGDGFGRNVLVSLILLGEIEITPRYCKAFVSAQMREGNLFIAASLTRFRALHVDSLSYLLDFILGILPNVSGYAALTPLETGR